MIQHSPGGFTLQRAPAQISEDIPPLVLQWAFLPFILAQAKHRRLELQSRPESRERSMGVDCSQTTPARDLIQ